MKKLSFLFLALILLLTGCSKKSTFTLKGNISSLSSDTILVFYQEPNYKLDTIIAQNGKFSYTINSDTFTIFSLLLSDKEVLPVFANKGESVTWNGTPGDIQIKGKGDNERMAYILQAIKKTKADRILKTGIMKIQIKIGRRITFLARLEVNYFYLIFAYTFNMQNKKKKPRFFCIAAGRAKKRPPQNICGGRVAGN